MATRKLVTSRKTALSACEAFIELEISFNCAPIGGDNYEVAITSDSADKLEHAMLHLHGDQEQ